MKDKIKMSKEDLVDLIIERSKETDKERRKSFNDIALISGYTKRQVIRISNELSSGKSKEEIIKHKNKGRVPTNAAQNSEIEFMEKFKIEYPVITIAQFKDYVDEDYINCPEKIDDVKKYNLVPRSYSWYVNLFAQEKWVSPIKHKKIKSSLDRTQHNIRPPRPRRGELIQLDGTPHDWFNNGHKYCLHLAVDDATSEILAGFFTENECLYGYCSLMVIVLEKHGIPEATYSDRHQIFKSQDGSLTNFGKAMSELGVEMIFALSAQSKGRIERMNFTEQNRLINDLKRFKVPDDLDKLNTWFNDFYVKYTNQKFAFTPLDPHDAFVPILDNQYDYNSLFSLRYERKIIADSSFSFNNHMYVPIDDSTGEVLYIRKDVKVDVRFEILTNTISIIRNGKKYYCEDLGVNAKGRRKNVMENSKDLNQFFEKKGK